MELSRQITTLCPLIPHLSWPGSSIRRSGEALPAHSYAEAVVPERELLRILADKVQGALHATLSVQHREGESRVVLAWQPPAHTLSRSQQ